MNSQGNTKGYVGVDGKMHDWTKELKFTQLPCPECKKGGDKTGFIVKMDCKLCLGTGRERL